MNINLSIHIKELISVKYKMSSAKETQAYLQKNENKFLKPYIFEFEPNSPSNHLYLESEDLKDLSKAAIKELILKDDITLTDKNRLELAKLLSNININKLKLKIDKCIYWLIFISKLIRKNSTLKEIEIDINSNSNQISKNNIQIKAWSFILNIAKSRLVSFKDYPFSRNDNSLNKILLSNFNLKEFHSFSRSNYDNNDLGDYLKYMFNSKIYLNEFEILSNRYSNPLTFDFSSTTGVLAEIKTLILEDIWHYSLLDFIDNAYLFKTEIINIRKASNDELKKEILHRIMKLSNNLINTVKKVIITSSYEYFNFSYIISDILKSNKYDIRKIPKIFVGLYKEIKIEYNNDDNTYNIDCKNHNENIDDDLKIQWAYKFYEKENISFPDFLNVLFNDPKDISYLHIDSYKNYYLPENLIEKHENEYVERVVNKMKTMYNEFKEINIHSKNMKIKNIAFDFNHVHSKYYVFYFTILEIMIQMGIKIDVLFLTDCRFLEVVKFMEEHKTLESLDINNINIKTYRIKEDDLVKLYQYSHLIEGKIKFFSRNEFAINWDYLFYHNLYNKFKKATNFIILYSGYFSSKCNYARIEDSNKIDNYIKDSQREQEIHRKANFCFMKIKKIHFDFDLKDLDLVSLSKLFSYVKECHHFLDKISIDNTSNIYLRSKVISMYLETNLDCMYRNKEDLSHKSSLWKIIMIISKKNKKCIKLHKIVE